MATDTTDARYIAYAASEQKVLRDGVMILVSISTFISLGVLLTSAKDYFALSNICCVKSYGPCGTFLIRSSFGIVFSSISIYVGSGYALVDASISTLVLSLVCVGFSFFALAFSLLSLRMRLTTKRHLVILNERREKNRKEINNATKEDKKSLPDLYEMFN
jgi:hypothetical protein